MLSSPYYRQGQALTVAVQLANKRRGDDPCDECPEGGESLEAERDERDGRHSG